MLRRFAGVDLGRAAAPDETTILRFRRLLEQHELCGKILDTVNRYLAGKGLRISTGTIVDATIIAAPSSTKNSKGERDPEMHQTRKGNQWHFGAKAHIGVDSKEGIVHSVCTSAASVSDVHMLPDLLHAVWAIAHRLCRLVWKILHESIRYIEQGIEPEPKILIDRARSLAKQLRKFGYSIQITPASTAPA